MSIETNRRDALAGAAVSGLVASVLASSATAQGTSVMAAATDADYQRDPTRWGLTRDGGPLPRLPASRYAHQRGHNSAAPQRLRPAATTRPWQSGKPHLLVQGRREAGPAIPCRSS